MGLETTYTPINGLEAKKILKSMMLERFDKIPLLKEGNAFKQVELGFDLYFKCYPADCPVPIAEWQLQIGLKDGEDLEFDKDKKKLELLKEKRDKMMENIDRIDEFLAKHAPEELFEDRESDSEGVGSAGVPDELRVRHNLLIPMIQTSKSGRRSETLVNPIVK